MIPAILLGPFLILLLVCLVQRQRPLIVWVGAVIHFILCALLTIEVLTGGAVEFAPGRWGAAAGLVFVADGLSILFLLTMAFTGVGVITYATAYRWAKKGKPLEPVPEGFWPLSMGIYTGITGVLLSANLMGTFIFLEILGGAAVGMAAVTRLPRNVALAKRYFFIRLPGSLAFFFGIALLYSAFGSLDFHSLREVLYPSGLVSLAAAMILLGVFIKASLFPLHFWLPPIHSAALGPAAVFLSAMVVKAPFYAALRIWFDVFSGVTTVAVAQFIGLLGSAGIIWGAALALRATRMKLLIAHSTVSQMGYLFLLFPLLTGATAEAWATAAWTGGIYQAIAHSMAKAALLMAAGVVLYSIGSDKLRDMHGLAGKLPVTTFTIALSCVTLIGLPPSGGFIGKWLLLNAALESGQWWWVPVLLLGGLLTAGYAFLMLSYAFQPREREPLLRKPRPLMEITALTLALASILIGLRVQEPMQLMEPQSPIAIEREVER